MSRVPMFRFELTPLLKVLPWESGHQRHLHWFGLTDGRYTIECGGIPLMRINQAIIDATPERERTTPFFDYQVARLHEDLLEILPHAIDPIPSDLVDLVRLESGEFGFEERSLRWADQYWLPPHGAPASEPEGAGTHAEFWERAAGWWMEDRQLSRGHMFGQPDIRLWCEGDSLHVRWTNDCATDVKTGLPWSVVPSGEHIMDRLEFLEEVRSFHERLMSAMQERVDVARVAWPRPEVEIDVDELVRQQAERVCSLDRALEVGGRSEKDWDSVREAVRHVVRLMGN
jgi:hypothetical protein